MGRVSDFPTPQAFQGGLRAFIDATLNQGADRVLLSDAEVAWSAADLRERIRQWSQVLGASLPLRARVGVFLPNTAVKAAAVLALFHAGYIPVLFSTLDLEEGLAERLSHLRLDGALVAEGLLEESERAFPLWILNARGEIVGSGGRPRSSPIESPTDLALILYTSGSSGEPKGVGHSEQGLLYNAQLLMGYQRLHAQTVASVVLPLSHTMALNTQFIPTFLSGGKSVFFDVGYSLHRLYRNLLESQGTHLALISHLVRLCHEERLRQSLPVMESVEQVTLAGGLIRETHLQMCRELFPNAVLYKGYGLTEAIRVSMISSRDPGFYEDTAGWVLPAQEVQIRNDEGRALAPGESGEIYVKGPNVMLGYESEVGEWSGVGSDGFLATHDLGLMRPDGALCIQGRSDGMVKVLGKRVSLKAVEEVAFQIWPEAAEAKCLAIPSRRVDQVLVLFVESPEAGKGFSRSEIYEFENKLKERLSHQTILPREIFFMRRIPRTSNGKIKVAELREVYAHKEQFERLAMRSDPHRMIFYSVSPFGSETQDRLLNPFRMSDVQQVG